MGRAARCAAQRRGSPECAACKGCLAMTLEARIHFHARWLGIAYKVCVIAGATLIAVCVAAQLGAFK